ncbi:MAG: hypothetical protein DI585_01525 [Pseudomonas fluorescens]|nr:MAG: hypothetical protein DI585_01525 [Pseudomonas fluorescens]
MRIAILGLSGDPMHLGHVAVALAIRAMGYERVWLMITPQNPLKQAAAVPYWHRRELARLLTKGHEDWLEVCDFEAGVAVHDPDLRTHTVLSALRERMPEVEFTFVLGADAWADAEKGFHTWTNFMEIPALASLLILPREPWTNCVLACPAAQALAHRHFAGDGPVPVGCWRVASAPIDHPASSTGVRENLKMRRASEHLTDAQNVYVRDNRLYE